MCVKNLQRKQFRSMLRDLEVGHKVEVPYDPEKMSLSVMRVTASSLGIDTGRKFSVSKQEGKIVIERSI